MFEGLTPLAFRRATAALWCLLLASCVTFTKSDLLPVPDRVLDAAALTELAGGRGSVDSLNVTVSERPLAVYFGQVERARGVLIAFGGNGNAADRMLRVLLPRARGAGLDLVVASYYVAGEMPPTVAQVRAAGLAVYRAAVQRDPAAAAHVYVLGHSLGCWFALDLAAHVRVQGVVLAAVGTTVADTFGPQYFPLNKLLTYRSDADLAQLDAVRDAHGETAPTIVFTSNADEAIPEALSKRVFDALPGRKRFIVLDGVSHGAYLSQPQVWAAIAELRDAAPIGW